MLWDELIEFLNLSVIPEIHISNFTYGEEAINSDVLEFSLNS